MPRPVQNPYVELTAAQRRVERWHESGQVHALGFGRARWVGPERGGARRGSFRVALVVPHDWWSTPELMLENRAWEVRT